MVAVGPEIAIRSRSPLTRKEYIETAEQASRPSGHDDGLAVLKRSATMLEMFYIGALVWEYIHEHDVRSFEQLRSLSRDIDDHVRTAFPDLNSANEGIRENLPEVVALAPPEWPSTIDWPQLVRSFQAVIAECPIEALELLAKRLVQPEWAHRARNAYDALGALVRRHDPSRAQVMRIVGEQYRRGYFGLQDAAKLLAMSTADAIFELERDGFGRAASAISMTELQREEVYARLRARRLSGERSFDLELVERDSIASERIEGVDARAWIRRR